MTETETTLCPIEVRAVDEAQRLATMLVCRYGEVSRREAKPERFVNGAFTESVSKRGDRIPFTDAHTGGDGVIRRPPVARPVSWDTTNPGELVATLRFFDTPEAWGVYTRARDGEFDGGSVGFRPLAERTAADGIREITEAELHHVMLCSSKDGTVPSYDAPRILEVRSAAQVQALIARQWDPAIAEQCVDPAYLAKLGNPE